MPIFISLLFKNIISIFVSIYVSSSQVSMTRNVASGGQNLQ
ncbi:hypothetical protein A628_00630 [Salmonella enterica subsp. enterica serovar Cubana str. 76814]|uniref:Uncharacterized protein n=1 Tax=Salmonella enterica subsp. enterica serovar Cubana str. 76814 TaxID=1192560 RepID=V7IWG0_SALET|nr:hypothetical protein A628_00630 [Salmonella enterica subsp. enterica serovar Cubana str. 76814]